MTLQKAETWRAKCIIKPCEKQTLLGDQPIMGVEALVFLGATFALLGYAFWVLIHR